MIMVDFENSFIFILLCLFSFLWYSFIFNKPQNSRQVLGHGCILPPTPPSLPIIGHLHLILSGLIHKSLQKLSSKYGPLLYLRIFNAPLFIVSSASVAYQFYRTHDLNVSFRGDSPLGESLLVGSFSFLAAPYGEYFRFMKKLLVTKMLGPHALERSRDIRAAEVKRFYNKLLDKAMKKESVEIGEESMTLTNNIISKIIMGKSFSEDNGVGELVNGLVHESIALIKKICLENVLDKPLKKLGISLFKKEIMDVSYRFDKLLEKILEEHEEKGEEVEETDIMDVFLAAQRDENAEYKITRNHIKSLFAELLVAGINSSRDAIEWTMAEIIKNPNVFKRLREEIESVVGKTRLIEETDVPNLPYLQAVVKESLRLNPPVAVFPRTSKEGCKMREFDVAENTPFFVNAYAVMRDPEYWEDPDEFKPERFLKGEGMIKEKSLKYIPFGGGRRGCPGTNLAYIFVEMAVGVMVQGFDWRINMEEVSGGRVSMIMPHPLICTPIPHTQHFISPAHDLENIKKS